MKLGSVCVIQMVPLAHPPPSLPPSPVSMCQAIVCDVPRLQYIILVDNKPASWPNIPRGIMVYSMDAVKEMGSKPENGEYLRAL